MQWSNRLLLLVDNDKNVINLLQAIVVVPAVSMRDTKFWTPVNRKPLNLSRAGLRHVRGVRPNKAADLRRAAVWDQIRPEPGLAFILPLIAVLTKEPEMLQPDAFCEHTMQQNATAAGAPPQTPLGSLQWGGSPQRGKRGKEKRGEGKRKGRWEAGGVEGERRGGQPPLMRSRNMSADWLRPALSN